jgi:anti-anti-sigma regulatory factor
MPGTWGLDGAPEGVFVHGEINTGTASEFEAQASEPLMQPGAGICLIDLSGVTFMDSA